MPSLVSHSEPDPVLTLGSREVQMIATLAQSEHRPPLVVSEKFARDLPKATRPAQSQQAFPETPARLDPYRGYSADHGDTEDTET